MAATFHTYGPLLHHTQYARSRWCIVLCTPLHCNNFEFTVHLRIVGLLGTALFQYLKCQDQRISKNCRSTSVFYSSWNLWGGPIFYLKLARGGVAHPCPPSVTPLTISVFQGVLWDRNVLSNFSNGLSSRTSTQETAVPLHQKINSLSLMQTNWV